MDRKTKNGKRMNNEFFFNLKEVIEKTGLKRSTLYYMIGAGRFPKQIKLGERKCAWKKEDIFSWLENKGITIGFNRKEYEKGYKAALNFIKKCILENEKVFGKMATDYFLNIIKNSDLMEKE
jgi:prophage regulatory protein